MKKHYTIAITAEEPHQPSTDQIYRTLHNLVKWLVDENTPNKEASWRVEISQDLNPDD